MKIILVNKSGKLKTYNLKVHVVSKLAVLTGLFCIPLVAGWLIGDYRSQTIPDFLEKMSGSLLEQVDDQAREVFELKQHTEDKIQALNAQVGKLQARIVRVEAVAQQVGEKANIDIEEYNFSLEPAIGGPIVNINQKVDDADTGWETFALNTDSLLTLLSNLQGKINDRLWQIELLEDLLNRQHAIEQSKLSGAPVNNGWLSSKYGYRSDPFTGRRAWHNGVDIAGREGLDVLSIASGVVTFAGTKEGYGNLVEIMHNSEYITRYGHNKDIKVKVGDVITKAQIVATMGSTGRSTGPHTHFEIYKNGRTVDPAEYIQKNIR